MDFWGAGGGNLVSFCLPGIVKSDFEPMALVKPPLLPSWCQKEK